MVKNDSVCLHSSRVLCICGTHSSMRHMSTPLLSISLFFQDTNVEFGVFRAAGMFGGVCFNRTLLQPVANQSKLRWLFSQLIGV